MCNIRQARCPTKLEIILGVLFLFATIIYAVIQIVQIEQTKDFDVSSSQALWQYWLYLYPVLIGLWTEITATVGMCASKQDSTKSICKICTFLQFSLILVGVQGYLLFDFTFQFLKTYDKINNGLCETLHKKITTNCYFRISLEGTIIALGGLIVLQALWVILCCCSAMCCENQTVEPRRQGETEPHVPAEMRVAGNSTAQPQSRQLHAQYSLNTRPVLPPINNHVTPSAPIMDAENNPIDDGNYPYNPNWTPAPSNHGYQRANPDSPPPYSEIPGSSEAIIIDRQTTQAYFIRPVHRGHLPPMH